MFTEVVKEIKGELMYKIDEKDYSKVYTQKEIIRKNTHQSPDGMYEFYLDQQLGPVKLLPKFITNNSGQTFQLISFTLHWCTYQLVKMSDIKFGTLNETYVKSGHTAFNIYLVKCVQSKSIKGYEFEVDVNNPKFVFVGYCAKDRAITCVNNRELEHRD